MKKLIFTALALVALLSCSDKYYITEIVEPEFETRAFTVEWNDWRLGEDATGIYYFRDFPFPELIPAVFDRAIMQAFLFYRRPGSNADLLSPLPFSDFLVDDSGYKWEEHFTVEFRARNVRFILKIDDHSDIDEFPELPFYDSYTFVVNLMW
ncbi:MAG: hypothetical protein LBI15_04195 [Dysgonamonadaceae bacterium]|jgi:hypothetical protein|nr:hypothetical protein [Dysgonamonadaceae bacterium]